MNKLPEQVIADILKKQFVIDVNRIFITNQNYKLPKDDDLFFTVGVISSRPYSSTNSQYEEIIAPATTPTLFERQEVVMEKLIQIDMFSRSTEALFRADEVLVALNSIYSQQKQEENSFKIFKIPASYINTSAAEAGSNLNRLTYTIHVHSWFRKVLPIALGDYYDSFTQRVDDENSIANANGIIEFKIDSGGIT